MVIAWIAGGGWMICHFFEYLSPFYFLSIEFRCSFSISYKKFQIMFIIVVFRLGCDTPSELLLFVPTLLLSILRLSSVCLRLFLCLMSFLLFPCVSVWENARCSAHIAEYFYFKNEFYSLLHS